MDFSKYNHFVAGSEADPRNGGQHRQVEEGHRGEGCTDGPGADQTRHPV